MSTPATRLGFLAAIVTIAGLGCGSSETGGAGGAGGSNTASQSSSASGSGSSTSSGAGGATTAYCDNEADEAARLRAYCPDNRNIQEISGDCGLDCLTAADSKACIADCIVDATGDALSKACAGCVALTVICASDNCLNACIADTQSELCLKCRCGENPKQHSCYDEYEACAGRHLTECDELAAGTWSGYPHPDAQCGAGGAGGAGGSGGAGGANP